MQLDALKNLTDVLSSIESIESFFPNGYHFKEYLENKMLRRAVERELEIIGEAMNRCLKIVPEIEIPEAKRIVAFRNRVIHGYDSVDNTLVWGVVINHLPALKSRTSDFLHASA